jgi:molecular chaperone GrpE
MDKDRPGSAGYQASQKEPEEPHPNADEKGPSESASDRPDPDHATEEMPEEQATDSGRTGKPGHREAEAPDKKTGWEDHVTEEDDLGSDGDDRPAPAEQAEPTVEWDGASPDGDAKPKQTPKPAKKKKKPAGKGSGTRGKPSEQEIFQRLMEKNEVILQLSKKNVELEAKHKALHDKRVRLLAEFENYRKRTRKEWELLKEQTKAEVIVEILSVVDDFERALIALEDQSDEFTQGIRLIYNNLLATLAKFGVTKMIALGEIFDPNYHMAVASIDSEEVESNHVVEVIQEGYLLDGTVIRPANVVIAK